MNLIDLCSSMAGLKKIINKTHTLISVKNILATFEHIVSVKDQSYLGPRNDASLKVVIV